MGIEAAKLDFLNMPAAGVRFGTAGVRVIDDGKAGVEDVAVGGLRAAAISGLRRLVRNKLVSVVVFITGLAVFFDAELLPFKRVLTSGLTTGGRFSKLISGVTLEAAGLLLGTSTGSFLIGFGEGRATLAFAPPLRPKSPSPASLLRPGNAGKSCLATFEGFDGDSNEDVELVLRLLLFTSSTSGWKIAVGTFCRVLFRKLASMTGVNFGATVDSYS